MKVNIPDLSKEFAIVGLKSNEGVVTSINGDVNGVTDAVVTFETNGLKIGRSYNIDQIL